MMRTFVGGVGFTRAACVTDTLLPATVSVVDLVSVVVLAATEYDTLPFPEPEPVSVTQVTGLEAAQVQPACVLTVIVPPVAVPAGVSASGATVNEQAAACVTVNVAPAIVSVPVREDVAVFAAILKL